MRILIRTFFRGLRLVLAPVVLIAEKLSTPKAIERSPEAQAEVERTCESLALYQFRTCPFCVKVRKEIARLGLPIEVRDAQLDLEHRQALAEGGGRLKVPCLKITRDDGPTEWLYESDAINAWLHRRFGEASPQVSPQ
ncbi:glutaredoxin [Halomonas sp. BM-2019]|uniref:glutaredoxin family protein n=1 Tax=Halomonas sp. BM-2019 TaxID=2811227 RepID=UPI001B3C4240|nr:MAG: glutaredoxin [Halomonas sp. BM-2019]